VLKNEVTHLASADRLGPIAAVGFLWVASGGLHGLMDAVEAVVGAPRRTWWKKRLYAIGWVLATLAAFGVAAFGIIEWDNVVHAGPTVTAPAERISGIARDEPAQARHTSSGAEASSPSQTGGTLTPKRARKILRSGGERVVTLAFSLAVAVGGLCAFYRFAVSHARRVRRRVLPGAVVAVALWIVVSWCFGVYLRTLASYTVYYGSLAAAPRPPPLPRLLSPARPARHAAAHRARVCRRVRPGDAGARAAEQRRARTTSSGALCNHARRCGVAHRVGLFLRTILCVSGSRRTRRSCKLSDGCEAVLNVTQPLAVSPLRHDARTRSRPRF